jgi:hypothetical protein
MSSSFPQGFTLRGFYIGSAELALEVCLLEVYRSFQLHNLLRKAGRKFVSIGKTGSSRSGVTVLLPLDSAHTDLSSPQCDIEETVRWMRIS